MFNGQKIAPFVLRLIVAATLVFGGPVASYAQAQPGSSTSSGSDINAAPHSETVRINRFSICRDVTGQMRNPVMVPARSKNEWAVGDESFVKSGANGTTLGPCMARAQQPVAGSYCAARPGAWVGFSFSGNTSTGNPTVPVPKFQASRTGKFLVGFGYYGTTLYLTGNGGASKLAAQQTQNKNYIHVARGFPTGGQYVFSPDDAKMALYKQSSIDFSSRMQKGPAVVTIYDISRVGGFYRAINPNSVNIGNATYTRNGGGVGTRYALTSFDLNANLFVVKTDYTGSCSWFTGCSITIQNKTLEIRTAASGYALTQSIPLPGLSAPQVSDDGSEFMVYDDNKGESLTYVRDPSTGQFSLAQKIKSTGGLLAPTIMAPGGTVAIGVKTGTPDRVYVRRGWTHGWVNQQSWNGQVTVYRKSFPDDPSWTVATNNTSAPYQVSAGSIQITSDGSELMMANMSDHATFSTTDLSVADSGPGIWGDINGKFQKGPYWQNTSGGCGGNCGSQTTRWSSTSYYKCN